MLKIIDDIDLKELDKFGFEKLIMSNCFGRQVVYTKKFEEPCVNNINISAENREIDYFNRPNLNTIFDLIQAGLVEKIPEEN